MPNNKQNPSVASPTVVRFPADQARHVNPDTHLELTFPSAPLLGTTGQIRIYDAADGRLVNLLDMSIPAGPTANYVDGPTPTGPRVPYMQVPYEYISGTFTNANTKPGTLSCGAMPTPDSYQLTIIGGFTDGFHFYPSNISTNEVEGTFPYRRAAFAVDHSSRIHLVNLTIRTTSERAQAEGLLLNGSENIICHVTIGGSGDALQSNGSA